MSMNVKHEVHQLPSDLWRANRRSSEVSCDEWSNISKYGHCQTFSMPIHLCPSWKGIIDWSLGPVRLWCFHITLLLSSWSKYCGSWWTLCSLSMSISIGEVTSDVTAGQKKLSEQKIALQYGCAPAGARGLKIPPHFRWCRDKAIELAHAYWQFNSWMRFVDKQTCHTIYRLRYWSYTPVTNTKKVVFCSS